MNWVQICRLRRLPVAKFAFLAAPLVPIIVVFIGTLRGIGVDVDIKTTLLVLYASSLLFVVASIIFDLKCPEIVSQHEELERFRSFEHKRIFDLVTLLNKTKPDPLLADNPQIALAESCADEVAKLAGRDLVRATADSWAEANQSSPMCRRLLIVLFAASLLGAGYVSLWATPTQVFFG